MSSSVGGPNQAVGLTGASQTAGQAGAYVSFGFQIVDVWVPTGRDGLAKMPTERWMESYADG